MTHSQWHSKNVNLLVPKDFFQEIQIFSIIRLEMTFYKLWLKILYQHWSKTFLSAKIIGVKALKREKIDIYTFDFR